MDLQEVIKCFNQYAPLHLSESWDNTGLLLEPHGSRKISKLLLTNDLTQAVMQEVESNQADVILSYHPPLFQPLKRITKKTWKERIIAHCLAKGIAIYSPHTCYDALNGGVNDWLISAFGSGTSSPITMSYEKNGYSQHVKISCMNPGKTVDHVLQKITSNLPQDTLGSIKIGKGGENVIDIFCKNHNIPTIVSKVTEIQTDIDHYEIYKLEQRSITDTGMGRKVKLDTSITVSQAVKLLKEHLKLKHLRLSLKHGGTLDDVISTIAVCAGAGSSVLRSVPADLYVTGELRHHEVLDFAQSGRTTILTDHSNSERGFLSAKLQPDLQTLLGDKVKVIVSKTDCDPLVIV